LILNYQAPAVKPVAIIALLVLFYTNNQYYEVW